MSKLALGVITNLTDEPEKSFTPIRDMGLTTCQLCSWQPMKVSKALVERARVAAEAAGVTISLFWCGYSGPAEWNYQDGPATIGLVPAAYREERTLELMRGAEIASWLGITDMATHVGFLPLNPKDQDYIGAVSALKRVAEHAAARNVFFNFETGQETPMVLLRTIHDIGTGNLGINLDPANLLLYGNGNPVDSLDIFGKYIRGVHAKDGEYPTDGLQLGKEKPLGEGRVNFPVLVKKLKDLGYINPITIEFEISGPEQEAGIRHAIKVLTPLL